MQRQDQVHCGQALERQVAHAGLQHVGRLEQAGQIVEHVLRVALGAEAHDGNPGGLRLGAHDRQVGPDERVEQR